MPACIPFQHPITLVSSYAYQHSTLVLPLIPLHDACTHVHVYMYDDTVSS